MAFQTSIWPATGSASFLALGAVTTYLGSRSSADAMSRGVGGEVAGRVAIGHWLPIALVALQATLFGRVDLALSLVFATSVAAIALSGGIVTFLAPPGIPPESRRAWPFLLAAAMLALVAGFSGRLTLSHAGLLLILGAVVMNVWRAYPGRDVERMLGSFAGPTGEPDDPPPSLLVRLLQLLLALIVAGIGARALVHGSVAAEQASKIFRLGMLSAAVVSPILILPTLATGTDLAQRGRSAEAGGGLIGIALLNICLLLPVVILTWHLQTAWPGTGGPAGIFHRLFAGTQRLPFPVAVWRIDVVLLAVLGFALIPVALGRWAIGRLESVGLVLVYFAYLAATAFISMRS